jgi:hypothetical protein
MLPSIGRWISPKTWPRAVRSATIDALAPQMLAILLGIVSAEQCDSDSGGYPRIVIGCWQLLERKHDQSEAVATLQSYVKAGFTAFDTADIYGPSEEILGKLRREIARSSETPPRFFTKYVTGDSSLQEARLGLG